MENPQGMESRKSRVLENVQRKHFFTSKFQEQIRDEEETHR
jgi:hypothetical protein